MVIAINKLFAQLLFWLYELLDTIFEMFAVLCGIETLETVDADAPRSLIEIFLQSSAVTRAFLLIVIVSVFVAAVSTIVAIVKNIINIKGGERKSHAKTVGQGFGSIIVTLCMALVMIVGISMSNIVLQKVYAATSPDDNVTPASILFDMCVSKDYVIDYSNPVPNMVPKIDPETGEVMKDENGEIIMEVEVDYEGNVVYFHHLRTWKQQYAPKHPEDEWHPLFVEALQRESHIEYLLDILLYGTAEEKKALVAEQRKEVIRLERRFAEHTAGHDRGRSQGKSGLDR